jgi:protein gp37
MGQATMIEWCDHTFNPWIGCSKVHAGCAHCYAEADMDHRRHRVKWGPGGTRSRTSDDYWKQPLKWNREAEAAGERRRVFCASLADVFEEWRGPILNHLGNRLMHEHMGSAGEEPAWVTMDDLRRDLFALIDQTPHLDWLMLTKRPENVRKMWLELNVISTGMIEEEEWLPIEDYPGYMVSNFGRVKGPRAILKGDAGEQGHVRVQIGSPYNKKLVHRLVLEAFVGPPPSPNAQGRHLDGNPGNNRLDNLCWGTQSDNWVDSKRHKTHRRYSKLREDDVAAIKRRASSGESFASIASVYDISATQVSNVVHGRQWKQLPTPYRKNCWIGYSASDQATLEQGIGHLLACRDLAPVLFLSLEPLLGPVDLRSFNGGKASAFNVWERKYIDWCIIGGESGPNARPCNVAWVRDIVGQCKDAVVPCFVKQLGSKPQYVNDAPDAIITSFVYGQSDPKGGNPDEWPADLRVREFPKETPCPM